MLDTEVVAFVRAELEGFLHLIGSGFVSTIGFLSLGSDNFLSTDSFTEGFLSLLQSSELSEEGFLLEFGGDYRLFSGLVSLEHDLLDGCISLGDGGRLTLLGGLDSGVSFLQSSVSFRHSLFGVFPAFVSSCENFHGHGDHLGGISVICDGSLNDFQLSIDPF